MIRPCYSTVAARDWTFDRVCRFAAEHGFAGVECRSDGTGGGRFASDPALTSGAKVRKLMDDHAIELACISTGLTFDRPIEPPVLGRLMPWTLKEVGDGRAMVDVAEDAGAETVRVFAHRIRGREKRRTAVLRIADRLSRVVDHTRHKPVRIVLENGGDFGRAEDLLDIASVMTRPGLMFAYDAAYGMDAGDDPVEAVGLLGASLGLVRLRDRSADGHPVKLGSGTLPAADVVKRLASTSPNAWVSTTWDRAWVEDLDPADRAIAGDAELIYNWADAGAKAAPAA